MKSLLSVRIMFVIAALYDGLLGLAFIVAGPHLFDLAKITPPNHWGYVHFAAGTLVLFGYMFLMIALRPIENRNLVLYGMLLKVCYISTVGWHWFHGGLPALWTWFGVADTAFLALFFWSMIRLEAAAAAEK
jgi:hypothetical protein